VVDASYRTVDPVEEWLESHRTLWSPNTVRGYATALAQWWTFLEQRDEVGMRLLAVEQACPEVHDPPAAPARLPAAVLEPPFQSHPRRLSQIRSSKNIDLVPGEERPQMRNMAMPRCGFLIILLPFLQLPKFPDVKRRQALQRRFQLAAKLRVAPENRRRLD